MVEQSTMNSNQQHTSWPADHPWFQQPTESDRAYRAFTIYLHLGPQARSQRAAAKIFGCSARNLGDWSKRHNWLKRCAAYDTHMEKIREQAIEAQVIADGVRWARAYAEHRQQKLALGNALLDKVKQMLQFPLSRRETKEGPDGKTIVHIHPARWDFGSAARMALSADALITQACSGELDPTKASGDAAKAMAEAEPIVDMDQHEVMQALKAVADKLDRTTAAPTP